MMGLFPGQQAKRAASLTTVAMFAFAGNSILCRLALKNAEIDPSSFTSIRLASGAITLLLIFAVTRQRQTLRGHGGFWPAAFLFVYALCFSFAYVSLDAGAGALILFGSVQATMIVAGLMSGSRPHFVEWLSWAIAIAGLVWLLLPGASASALSGAMLMYAAGVAWGLYSIRGKLESDPLAATSVNFALSLPLIVLLVLVTYASADLSRQGVVLAIVSGALTSGVGDVIWYAALDYLSPIRAALVQLSVPAIAAGGGILLLAEPLTARMLLSSVLVLGGISLAISNKRLAA